jgi:hypothetical protein
MELFMAVFLLGNAVYEISDFRSSKTSYILIIKETGSSE